MLPSQSNPLLVFLGVNSTGDEAGFMVDSTVQTTGEGRCTPSEGECSIVFMEAGEEQMFTGPDGNSFTLRLDQIRQVALSKAVARGASRPVARTANDAGAPDQGAPSRRFSLPLFSDLEIDAE